MTRRQKRQISRELAAIATLKDSDIDTSEIPEVTNWSQAVVGKFYRSEKTGASRPANAGAGSTSRRLPNPFEVDRSAGIALVEITHQQLITQCLQGQTAAWGEFIRRYEKLIAAVVLRTAKQWGDTSQELIQDLIQEVYLRLCAGDFQLLRKFDSRYENAFLGFLKVLASNIVRDHFRAALATKYMSAETPLLETSAPGSMDTVAQAELDILVKEIDRLLKLHASERERAIFWLYYRQGLTAQAIANIPPFNLTVKGIESMVRRLTEALKRELVEVPPAHQSQRGTLTLPLTDLNEDAIHQVLRRIPSSPKKSGE